MPGETGQTGEPGPRGPKGTPGFRGDKGRRGLPGVAGQNGAEGERGPPGKVGPPGEDGENGLQGNPGQNGLPGKDGKDGLPGKDGANGKNGADGIDGQPGRPGAAGETGDPGPAGGDFFISFLNISTSFFIFSHFSNCLILFSPRVVPGKRGPRGDVGEPGHRGRRGAPGAEGVQGPMGLAGPAGPAGTPGLPAAPAVPPMPAGTGVINGMVRSALTGQPVAGADVSLSWNGVVRNSILSSASGTFRFNALPAETFVISTQAAGQETIGQTISLANGQTRDYSVALGPPLGPRQARIVLTWNALPLDLDAHLDTPGGCDV